MSDLLDEGAFQAMAPWGREERVVPLTIAKEQQDEAHRRGWRLGQACALPPEDALGDFIASKVLTNDDWTPHGLARDIVWRIRQELGEPDADAR